MYFGVVEDRQDPMFLGRCKVRVVGVHTDNKTALPIEDLPWAFPVSPITSAAMSGIGTSPLGPVEGTWVVVLFNDDALQQPFILGTVGGIPFPQSATTEEVQAEVAASTTSTAVTSSDGQPVVDSQGTPIQSEGLQTSAASSEKYLGQMTKEQYDRWKKAIGQKESGGRYTIVNTIGYAGKYQFGVAALEDLGYVVKGTWAKYKKNSVLSDPTVWTGKSGIASLDAWKSNGPIQEEVMDIYTKRNYRTMKNAGLYNDDVDAEKLGGLLAVAHNQGAGASIKWVKKGQSGADAYGTTVEGYYQYGFNAVGGNKTNELPPKNMGVAAADKSVSTVPNNTKYDPVVASTQAGITTQPTATVQLGFRDPNGIYPLPDHLKEPDTNRLARKQKIAETIVGVKEADRVKSIAIANSALTWHQPEIPYNATYPYNHVVETESGHTVELDDTPGHSRINIHHNAGTFIEIDDGGNQTNRVAATKVVITDKDDLLYVMGSKHIAVDHDCTILVRGQAQVQIKGDCVINIEGNAFTNVAGNIDMKAGGHINMQCGGQFNLKAGGNFAADAPQIHLNGGQSAPATKGPDIAPTIYQPSPETRQESQSISLEGTQQREEVRAEERKEEPPMPPPAKVDETPPPAPIKPDEGVCDFTTLTYETQLTTNFTLGSMCKESGRPFPFNGTNNGLTDKVIACNLKQLCLNVLEPIKAKYASLGMKINSGYRNGSGTSQHTKGEAADISFTSVRGVGSYNTQVKKFYDIAVEIRDSGIPFDQLIFETDPAKGWVWIHVSYAKTLRRMTLSYYGKTPYTKGLVLPG